MNTVSERPDLFAGFAKIGGGGETRFFSPALKKNADRIAIYSVGGTKLVDGVTFDTEVALFKKFGFTQIATFRPDCGKFLPPLLFEQMTRSMMSFFDRVMAANSSREQAEAATLNLLAKSVVTERRPLRDSTGSYLLVIPSQKTFPAAKTPTLLICLYGLGDTADGFAKNFVDLVKSRPDVMVAVPDLSLGSPGGIRSQITGDWVTTIIADTVARDHVNPQQVILLGAGTGGIAAGAIVGEHPGQFAGFADFASNLPDAFFSPALQENATDLAVYYAVGTNEYGFSPAAVSDLQRLDRFGFSYLPSALHFRQTWDLYGPGLDEFMDPFPDSNQINLRVERFNSAQGLTAEDFKYRITRMMHFFDLVEAGKEARAAAATVPVVETRTLGKPAGSYLLLKSDQSRFSAVSGTALLICLPDDGETAADCAKYWMNLVEFCPSVRVAVPVYRTQPRRRSPRWPAGYHGLGGGDRCGHHHPRPG